MAAKNNQPSKQFEAFKETARALGCDEDKERFEKALGRIAAYKPKEKSVANTKNTKAKKLAK